jgi:hypothetical protein
VKEIGLNILKEARAEDEVDLAHQTKGHRRPSGTEVRIFNHAITNILSKIAKVARPRRQQNEIINPTHTPIASYEN